MPYKDPEAKRKYYAANRERLLEQQRQNYAANRERKREYNRKYRAANLERERERDRQRHADNRELERERNRQYREANRERLLERQRQYREASRERRSEERRTPEYRARSRAWASERRARLRKVFIEHVDWEDLLETCGGCCAICGSTEDLHMDHVHPISRAKVVYVDKATRAAMDWPPLMLVGGHEKDNTQVLCGTHNVQKNARRLADLPPAWWLPPPARLSQ